MDESGYIPVAFLCTYISFYGPDYSEVIKHLKELESLEVDIPNETVRRREGWRMVMH